MIPDLDFRDNCFSPVNIYCSFNEPLRPPKPDRRLKAA
jgi:hypothetical protein